MMGDPMVKCMKHPDGWLPQSKRMHGQVGAVAVAVPDIAISVQLSGVQPEGAQMPLTLTHMRHEMNAGST